ncbi:MAG: 3-oxoacyl-[acyl-carrier-protein] reductase [Planctomycetes bacterium]|nr:3-oxoacyl-[acyl-carrier-protein] reductase [Planctomycetota bacterium]
MAGPFDGVSVLVTGGTRGIGRSIVQAFAADGAKVTFTGTNDAAAAETIAGCPDAAAVRYAKADVSDGAAVKAAVDAAVAHGGGLDVLVNNAGITKDNLLLRMTDEEWDRVQDVNLKGVFLTTRAASRTLMRSKRGRIVNVTSVVGLMGNAGQANYAASKGGVIAFTKAVARELAGRAVTCNAVAPGYITTDMTAGLPAGAAEELQKRIPLGRLGRPEDVAGAVKFLASLAAGYVTGQVLCVDGGMVM